MLMHLSSSQSPFEIRGVTFLMFAKDLIQEEGYSAYLEEASVRTRLPVPDTCVHHDAKVALVMVHGSDDLITFAKTFYRVPPQTGKWSQLLAVYNADVAKVKGLLIDWAKGSL